MCLPASPAFSVAGSAIACCALSPVALPGARAAQMRQLPLRVSAEGEDPQSLQLASDIQGESVALWRDDANPYSAHLKLAMKPSAGTWRKPMTLRPTNSAPVEAPSLALAHGNAVVATAAAGFAVGAPGVRETGDVVIRAVAGPVDGFAQRRSVGLSQRGHEARDPQVAIDERGDAIVAWKEARPNSGFVVKAAVRPVAGGQWRAPVELASVTPKTTTTQSFGEREEGDPRVATDPGGEVLVVWDQQSGTGEDLVRIAIGSLARDRWERPQTIGTGGRRTAIVCPDIGPRRGGCVPSGFPGLAQPTAALDSHGEAAVVWAHAVGAQTALRAAVRAHGGRWRASTLAARGGQEVTGTQLALDANGEAVIAWTGLEERETILQVASGLVRRNQWQTPMHLAAWPYTPPSPCRPGACKRLGGQRPTPTAELAVGVHGEAVVLWKGTGRRSARLRRRQAHRAPCLAQADGGRRRKLGPRGRGGCPRRTGSHVGGPQTHPRTGSGRAL